MNNYKLLFINENFLIKIEEYILQNNLEQTVMTIINFEAH